MSERARAEAERVAREERRVAEVEDAMRRMVLEEENKRMEALMSPISQQPDRQDA